MDSSVVLNSNVAMASYLPIISMVIAMLAVIVGPFISLRIAKRQTSISLKIAKKQTNVSLKIAKSQTIFPMRLAWIESLRELIAEFLLNATYINNNLKNNSGDPEFVQKQYGMSKAKYSIELMINPNEQQHIELVNKLNQIIDTVVNLEKADEDIWSEFVKDRNEIYEISRKVFKSEWNRIKNWKD